MSLGMNYSPTVPRGGAASYKLRPVFTYNNGYWEVYRRFQNPFPILSLTSAKELTSANFDAKRYIKRIEFSR